MNAIDAAVLRTILYADVFSFPLTAREIHHFLIHDSPVTQAQVDDALARLTDAMLETTNGFYALAGRGAILALRLEREAASQALTPLAERYGVWLSRLPFVRMVALTGALAMRNAADAHDDIDYMLVTAAHRVWLARAFSIVLVRLARLRGVTVCPNYVLAESALAQARHDLFIAHEVVQMTPLYGLAVYERMRHLNAWVAHQLPNAGGAFYARDEQPVGGVWALVRHGFEFVFGGRIGDALEAWEQRRKLRRFASEMRTPHSAAQLDGEHVKGHFNDHGYRVLAEYEARLREYGLSAKPLPLAGD